MRNSYIEAINNPERKVFYEDAKRIADSFETEAYVKNGIVRWNSNDRIPPTDVLELWYFLEKDFSIGKSIEESEKETREFLKNYRKKNINRTYSEEERFEMEAAFGKGATVVDVITGKEITL